MTTSSIIRNRVAEMPADVVFTYQDFGLPTCPNIQTDTLAASESVIFRIDMFFFN